jgi:hypothetical protein
MSCHLLTFTSSQFDVSVERPNPINPIAGESVLIWLREQLRIAGYEATVPEPEDWGWYMYLRCTGGSYLVGAGSDVDQAEPREWAIQIHRERSVSDKLFGRNRLAPDDPLSAVIEKIVRGNQYAKDVVVDRKA